MTYDIITRHSTKQLQHASVIFPSCVMYTVTQTASQWMYVHVHTVCMYTTTLSEEPYLILCMIHVGQDIICNTNNTTKHTRATSTHCFTVFTVWPTSAAYILLIMYHLRWTSILSVAFQSYMPYHVYYAVYWCKHLSPPEITAVNCQQC